MPDLSSSVGTALGEYYAEMSGKVHQWVDPLTTEQVWARPFGFQARNPSDGNSIGHLILHLTGNLNYYVGTQIAGTGYVRNRPLEFADAEKRSKEKILADFDRTIGMVVETIRKQKPEDWTKRYTAEREPEAQDRFTALFRCAAHAYHHVGQMIYLSKELNPKGVTETRPG